MFKMSPELMIVLMRISRRLGKRRTIKMLETVIHLMIVKSPSRTRALIILKNDTIDFVKEL
jgi:hypothetical protein